MMTDELTQAINDYRAKWHTLVAGRQAKSFFEALKPDAVGWKVTDQADFDRQFAYWRERSDQIHLGWINERWLATMHLRQAGLPWDIEIVKLMQRRPGSTDAVGLDHLDFLLPAGQEAATIVAAEPELHWTQERNGNHCRWISLWFADTEAKLHTDTVLQVCVDELLEIQKHIIGQA